MLDREHFIKKLSFYHLQINECYSCYVQNVRINDWYDKYKKDFSRIKSLLGVFSRAMLNDFYITVSKLFDNRNPKSLCIQRFINTIKDNCIIDKTTTKQLQESAKKLEEIIIEEDINLKALHDWRDKYYAHYDKQILSTSLKNLDSIDTDRIINLVKFTWETLNEMLKVLGEEKIVPMCDIVNEMNDLFGYYLLGRKQPATKAMEFFGNFEFPQSL